MTVIDPEKEGDDTEVKFTVFKGISNSG